MRVFVGLFLCSRVESCVEVLSLGYKVRNENAASDLTCYGALGLFVLVLFG